MVRVSRRTVAGSLSIAAALVLILALFMGWYVFSTEATPPGSSYTYTTTFFPGQKITFSNSCSGSHCGPGGSNSTTYSAARLGDTGRLYALFQIVVVISILLGILAGALMLIGPKGKPPTWGTYLILAALVLALAGPVGLWVVQPVALSHDPGSDQIHGPSPATSFFGSCSGSSCPGPEFFSVPPVFVYEGTASWGPGIGWYLAFGAFALLAASAVVVRKRSTPIVSSPKPASSETGSVESI
jgi:hypothetical protein